MPRPNLFPRPETQQEARLLAAMAERAFLAGQFLWAASLHEKLARLIREESEARTVHFLNAPAPQKELAE